MANIALMCLATALRIAFTYHFQQSKSTLTPCTY